MRSQTPERPGPGLRVRDDGRADVIGGKRFPRPDAPAACPFCGAARRSRRIPVAFGQQAWIAECADCRLAFQSPPPSLEASRAYMDWRWRSADDYVGCRESQEARAAQQLGIVRRFLDAPIRLLDFGAGAGAFVRAARELGWTVSGVEPCAAARRRALDFHGVELREALDGGPYDAATMWDVVEHLPDPVRTLREIGGRLARNGWLFLETGNFENWKRVAEGDRWGLYLFDHRFYFSPASLKRALRDAGFAGFRLLGGSRARPPIHPGLLRANPRRALLSWKEWARARARWPRHGHLNILAAAARWPGAS